MKCYDLAGPANAGDLAWLRENRSGAVVPELDDLRRLVKAREAFVFVRSPKNGSRLLATSPPALSAPSEPPQARTSFQFLERAGCIFAMGSRSLRPAVEARHLDEVRNLRQREHLIARTLGRLILHAEGAVLYQVSEDDPRCLAIASPAGVGFLEEAESIAPSGRPVLICGETGVGKELMARYIHRMSGRKKFVAVSMAQMQGETAVSELFGHAPGAFTGASSRRLGAFVEAADGTLFLDEISEMSPAAAALLLRALEEKSIKPLGSDKAIDAPARIIAATNHPDALRPELLYRFLHRLVVPPLRERKEDIRAIALFIAFREGYDLSEKALATLPIVSAWEGNARELEYFLFRARKGRGKSVLGFEDILRSLETSLANPMAEGTWLRAIRENLGLSLREFAQALTVPKSTLDDLEKGRSRGRARETSRRVARYLEKRVELASPRNPRRSRPTMTYELKRFLKEE